MASKAESESEDKVLAGAREGFRAAQNATQTLGQAVIELASGDRERGLALLADAAAAFENVAQVGRKLIDSTGPQKTQR
jgi:hypothetical protein